MELGHRVLPAKPDCFRLQPSKKLFRQNIKKRRSFFENQPGLTPDSDMTPILKNILWTAFGVAIVFALLFGIFSVWMYNHGNNLDEQRSEMSSLATNLNTLVGESRTNAKKIGGVEKLADQLSAALPALTNMAKGIEANTSNQLHGAEQRLGSRIDGIDTAVSALNSFTNELKRLVTESEGRTTAGLTSLAGVQGNLATNLIHLADRLVALEKMTNRPANPPVRTNIAVLLGSGSVTVKTNHLLTTNTIVATNKVSDPSVQPTTFVFSQPLTPRQKADRMLLQTQGRQYDDEFGTNRIVPFNTIQITNRDGTFQESGVITVRGWRVKCISGFPLDPPQDINIRLIGNRVGNTNLFVYDSRLELITNSAPRYDNPRFFLVNPSDEDDEDLYEQVWISITPRVEPDARPAKRRSIY